MALSVQDAMARVRDKIAKAVLAIGEEERAADQLDRMAAAVDGKLDECAAAEAAGELTSEQVSRRLDDLEGERRRHQSAAEQRRRVIAVRRREVSELERELELIPYRAAVEAYEATTRTHDRRAGEFARALAPAVKAATALVRARAASGEAYAAAAVLCPADLDLPGRVDEPEWPDVSELAELLAGGRVAPALTAAADERNRAARAAVTAAAVARQAVEELAAHIDWTREEDVHALATLPKFAPIPADRHEHVLDLIERRRAEIERDWVARNPAKARVRELERHTAIEA